MSKYSRLLAHRWNMTMEASELDWLHESYARIRPAIESRLKEFVAIRESADDAAIFKELVFCLFTPQSKAKSCWAAVERVCDCNLLLRGTAEQISAEMSGVRFHHTKARRVVQARTHLPRLKARVAGFKTSVEAREWLVTNIVGMSYKESSHFLRNIGMGGDMAILDRHILKNLVLLGVIPEIPKSLSPKKYLEIEARMRAFCSKNGFEMAELDMVLWCRETGEIFK